MTKKPATPGTEPPVARTSAGLRDVIFDEIDAVRSGTSNPTLANAIAKLATGIVETVRMEIEVQRHMRHHDASSGKMKVGNQSLGAPIPLGAST